MKIGIVGWKPGQNSFGVTLPYLEYLRGFDAEIVQLFPWSDPVQNGDLSLIVLPGGPDINPNNYGQQPGLTLYSPCPYRENFDRFHLPRYVEMGTPIFGICRGMQAIAVHFGAQLYQDIHHETSAPEKRWDKVHSILLDRTAAVALDIPITKKLEFKVNSLHHQLVMESTLPSNLSVIGHYNDCPWGGVEVIAHTELPIAGVQYHPEELGTDIIADSIITRLLTNREAGLTQSILQIEEEHQIVS